MMILYQNNKINLIERISNLYIYILFRWLIPKIERSFHDADNSVVNDSDESSF